MRRACSPFRRAATVAAMLVGCTGSSPDAPAPAESDRSPAIGADEPAADARPQAPEAAHSDVGSREPAEPGPEGEPTAPPLPPVVEGPEPKVPIEDPSGVALDGFFAALARTEADSAGALTRVLHMGDSSIGLDGLPHAIRSRMQTRFGDGGAGFVMLGRYSLNYKTKAAVLRPGDGWKICYIAYGCHKDGHYGLGGHTFRSVVGAQTSVSTLTRGELGRAISRVELWYAGRPKGGRLSLQIDREPAQIIETAAEALDDRWHQVRVEPGPHRVTVRAAGHGLVRAYGVVLETDGPGVVWDTVSMIGAFTKRLHLYDDGHIARQVAHRDPDLLVLNYGGNDVRRLVEDRVDAAQYKEELGIVVRKLRAGKPELPCLVASVIDHGYFGKRHVEPAHIEAMVRAQRELAVARGCAFFDTLTAMGGPGSVREWLKRSPRLAEPDLKHLNHRGRDLMGEMMYNALMAAYAQYKRRGGQPARAQP